MNGENRRRMVYFLRQQRGDEPCLPIMAMHDIRPPLHSRAAKRERHRHTRQQRIAHGVVWPREPVGIEIRIAGTIIGRRKIQKPGDQWRARKPAFEEPYRRCKAFNRKLCHFFEFARTRHGVVIGGQQEPYVSLQRGKRHRQAADDITQPARFDQGIGFARHKENFRHVRRVSGKLIWIKVASVFEFAALW